MVFGGALNVFVLASPTTTLRVVPLPRDAGEENCGAAVPSTVSTINKRLVRRLSSPAKRGRGTTRSVVEGVVGLDHRRRQSHEAVGDRVDCAQHINCGDARHGHALT